MPLESLHRRFRKLTVSDIDAVSSITPTVVRQDASLRETVDRASRTFAGETAARVIAVVDASDRLVGILPLRWLSLRILTKVMPERALHMASGTEEAARFAPITSGETAGRVMLAHQSVRLDTPLDEAFERILKLNLDGLPIVDDEQRVIGYFDIAEILVAWTKLSNEEGV